MPALVRLSAGQLRMGAGWCHAPTSGLPRTPPRKTRISSPCWTTTRTPAASRPLRTRTHSPPRQRAPLLCGDSFSVIAPLCATADALTKVLFVAGYQRALTVAQAWQTDALLIHKTGQLQASPGLQRLAV